MSLLTVTHLRKKIYSVADRVIKTGVPAQFTKDGHVLTISVSKTPNKLDNLKKHHAIVGDPMELVDIKLWEWNEPKNL